jgi:Helix-turn-helix domain
MSSTRESIGEVPHPGVSGGRLLGVVDLAQIFDVGEETIRTWAKSGRLPAPVRVGREYRWHPRVIARFVLGE